MMSVERNRTDELPNLSHTDLSHDLSRADFSLADLSRAELSNADLSHADLSRADFSHADLTHSDLRITIPIENEEEYSDEFDTDLEDTDITARFGSGNTDTDLGTDSYRQACQRLKIPLVKIAQDQLWCKHVELRHVGLGPTDAKALAYALSKNYQVENLDLAENSIGLGVGYLIDMLRTNMHISVLNLASNDIDGQAAAAIGELLYSDLAVTDLNLANNRLKDLGCQYISKGLQGNSILRRLNLSGNEISVGGVQAMAKAMCENTTLISLDLSWNHIRQRAAVLLCKGMQSNHGILSLNLSWNGFGFEGSLALKELFSHNNKLRKIDLTNNRINWEGASFLAMGLADNTTLEILKLGQNPLTMDGCSKILESVSHPGSHIRFISFQEIPIDSRVAFKAEDIARYRDFNISHGGIVFSRDVFGTPFKKETGPEDPVSLLRRFLTQRGIRVLDLFRIFDTKDRQMVSKENFIRGLKRIQVPLDDEEMEEVSKHFIKTDNYITFKDLADGVRKNFQKQQRHDWKEEFQEKKRKEEHRRILAPTFTSIVLPAIQYFPQPISYNYSTPVTGGPSTRASTSMPGRKTRASVSFGELRRTPRTQVEILPPLGTPTPSTDNNSGNTSFDVS